MILYKSFSVSYKLLTAVCRQSAVLDTSRNIMKEVRGRRGGEESKVWRRELGILKKELKFYMDSCWFSRFLGDSPLIGVVWSCDGFGQLTWARVLWTVECRRDG